MFKHRSITTWLSLAALVAILGGGLLAATTDAITSEGNQVQSNALTATPTGVDVQGTVVGDASSCNDSLGSSAFSDGPLPAVVTGTFDLNSAEPSVSSDVVCLRNIGDTDAVVTASGVNPVLTELGACEQSEIDAGDGTCGVGAAGELGATFGAETSTACPLTGLEFTIPAGGYCDYQYDVVPVFFDTTGNPTNDRTVAQTDAFTYDLVWQAESVVVTCTDSGGDVQADAQTISLSSTPTTTACDDDWYRILGSDFDSGLNYTVNLTFLHADADLDLEIRNPNGDLLAASETLTDNEQVTFQAPSFGDVFIRVVYFNAPGPNADYSLNIFQGGSL